ncbi:MAG: chorismate synthase [Treponemataceae bacterium]|nr:MAG: chorismate synthase [Treponemataceae bacterium]
MAGNTIGQVFRVTTFGESHGKAIGCIVDGCPPLIEMNENIIQKDLDRRKPAGSAGTARRESDTAQIISGVFEGKTTGTPIAVIIENSEHHSADYAQIAQVFRPGHADYTYSKKYGIRDYRGGGRASGRETACRVAAGAIAKAFILSVLPRYKASAWTQSAAGITCSSRDLDVIEKNAMKACDLEAAAKMEAKIEELREKGDSAGGIVECSIEGLRAGLGEPVFDKLEAQLAKAMLSIGAVKGIEFGAGFSLADMRGSQANDAMRVDDDSGNVLFSGNTAGGTLGGISTGQALTFRLAIKPVPSIFLPQETIAETVEETANEPVNGTKKIEDDGENRYENTLLKIKGRHDVCLCPRIVPVAQAMAHIVIADMLLR